MSLICQGCTRPISTNPQSKKADELRLTRGICFVERTQSRVGRGCRAGVVLVRFLLRLDFVFFPCAFPANAHDVRHVPGSLAAFRYLL